DGVINALKHVNKSFSDIKVVANGAGAAGISIIRLLYSCGVRNRILCDSRGAIYDGREHGMNEVKDQIANFTNNDKEEGQLEDVLEGADVIIGVYVGGALNKDM